jgi:CelD/BcsL family acetyltransferase involved in cellulose biosynthesis
VTGPPKQPHAIRQFHHKINEALNRRPGPRLSEEVSLAASRAELELLAPQWDLLAAQTAPVLSSAWARSWADVYGSHYRLRILFVEGPTGLRCVLPLVRSKRTPWRLELLGLVQLREYSDVLSSDGQAVESVIQAVATWRLPLRLARVPSSSQLLPALRRAYTGVASLHVRPVPGTPVITLDKSWAEPEGRFSSRRRADFRAARRRAQRMGELTADVHCPSANQVDGLFDDLVRVEAAGWKTAAGTALRYQPHMRRFFQLYCRRAARNGMLRLAFLRVDGRPIAAQLAIEQASRFWLLKIGHDESFSRCSPGTLLMLHTVAWAAARGLETYEFLGQEEAWTTIWTRNVRSYVAVHTRPVSPWTPVSATEELARGVARTALAHRS